MFARAFALRAAPSWRRAAQGLCALLLTLVAPEVAADPAPAPVVYLHGLCGTPDPGCQYFRRALDADAELVCPRAPTSCGGGGFSWRASAGAVQRAVRTAAEGSVLLGFSQGGFAVRRLAALQPGRWRALVVVATFTSFRASELRRWGVERVVLAARRGDLTRRQLEDNVRALQREGFAARFVDLGPGGHACTAREGLSVWREALAWARGGEADALGAAQAAPGEP